MYILGEASLLECRHRTRDAVTLHCHLVSFAETLDLLVTPLSDALLLLSIVISGKKSYLVEVAGEGLQ